MRRQRQQGEVVGDDEVGGDVQVASFNVLNYFTTIDRPGAVPGPEEDPLAWL